MAYDHRKCEDEDDVQRMASIILRCLGFVDVQVGKNGMDCSEVLSKATLHDIAVHAERIARWARKELKEATARKMSAKKCDFERRARSFAAREVGCPLDHCICGTHDVDQKEHVCDVEEDSDDLEDPIRLEA